MTKEELRDFGDWFEQVLELRKDFYLMRNYEGTVGACASSYLLLDNKAFEMAVEYANPEKIEYTEDVHGGEIWEHRRFNYNDFEVANCRKKVEEDV